MAPRWRWDLGEKKQGGWPSCSAFSTQRIPHRKVLAFDLWHQYVKRLIQMPGPQGPLTHISTFVSIMKAEHLVIREIVLKTEIYK